MNQASSSLFTVSHSGLQVEKAVPPGKNSSPGEDKSTREHGQPLLETTQAHFKPLFALYLLSSMDQSVTGTRQKSRYREVIPLCMSHERHWEITWQRAWIQETVKNWGWKTNLPHLFIALLEKLNVIMHVKVWIHSKLLMTIGFIPFHRFQGHHCDAGEVHSGCSRLLKYGLHQIFTLLCSHDFPHIKNRVEFSPFRSKLALVTLFD